MWELKNEAEAEMRKTAVQLEGDSHCNVNKHTDSHFLKMLSFAAQKMKHTYSLVQTFSYCRILCTHVQY